MECTERSQPGGLAGRRPAILLVGPTASGKTPLGDLLEARGLAGRPCVHFDFGAALRRCATGQGTWARLTRRECAVLSGVLQDGALLEDEHFPIARRLLLAFLEGRAAGPETLLVLNGLPRHVGQAKDIEQVVAVEAAVHLSCPADMALARVRSNVGGDRASRPDDGAEAVRQRFQTFERRTVPLLAYYRQRGVPVVEVAIGPRTTAEAVWETLNRRLG